MTDFLREIIAHKRGEVGQLDITALKRAALRSALPRDFRAAVQRGTMETPPRLIAEIKLASPSRGVLATELDVLSVADIYAQNGAAAISVLTDRHYFHGRLETLKALRFTQAVHLPLLRKDFIIDEAQVYESRANGADAILLIVAAFEEVERLAALHLLASELGLAALVEAHDEGDIERVLKIPGIRLVGINNRDLSNFQTRLETTERLRPMIPASITVVAESGIRTARDVQHVANAGVDAVLVGEALVTAQDISAKVRELAGVPVSAHD